MHEVVLSGIELREVAGLAEVFHVQGGGEGVFGAERQQRALEGVGCQAQGRSVAVGDRLADLLQEAVGELAEDLGELGQDLKLAHGVLERLGEIENGGRGFSDVGLVHCRSGEREGRESITCRLAIRQDLDAVRALG